MLLSCGVLGLRIEHDPEAVQAGPMIERLITETLGGGWTNLNGMAANIAFPCCHPQPLHQDQAASGWTQPNAPTLLNTMFVLQDVDELKRECISIRFITDS